MSEPINPMELGLESLSEEERRVILSVLEKNRELQINEEKRLRQMRQDIKSIRHISQSKSFDDAENKTPSDLCFRCKTSLKNTTAKKGEPCPICHNLVCHSCRRKTELKGSASAWACKLCVKKYRYHCAAWTYSENNRNGEITVPDYIASVLQGEDPNDVISNNNSSRRQLLDTRSIDSRRHEADGSVDSLSLTDSEVDDRDVGASLMANHVRAPKPRPSNHVHKSSKDMGHVSTSQDSTASAYTGAGDTYNSEIEISGEVNFAVEYNYEVKLFYVKLRALRNLAVADSKRDTSDPFVKVYLLPDKAKLSKRKTKTKPNSLNPEFAQIFKFQLPEEELFQKTLNISVWHEGRLGKATFLGEVNRAVSELQFNKPYSWHPLEAKTLITAPVISYRGKVSLALKFMFASEIMEETESGGSKQQFSTKGQLNVHVKGARNLTGVRSNGTSNPFCKVYLLPEPKLRYTKQKTRVLKRNTNPEWDHHFIYDDISMVDLRQRSLELTIWDQDRMYSNDFLGGVRLNLSTGQSFQQDVEFMDARPDEMDLWQKMINVPGEWVEGVLDLRPHMKQLTPQASQQSPHFRRPTSSVS